MSPAIKSDGARSRGIRILSLIDGSTHEDFEAACNTAEDQEIIDQNLVSFDGPIEKQGYQSLDQQLMLRD